MEIKEKLQNQLCSSKELIAKNEIVNGNYQLKIHDQASEISALKKVIKNINNFFFITI